jgi:hypothetical protein
MTAVGPISPFASQLGAKPEPVEPAHEAAQSSTALVPVAPVERSEDLGQLPSRRSSASFLAQLIANDQRLPQTRERRRAEPHEAVAAYGAVVRLTNRK